MTSRPRTPAYFAVARGIGKHPLFTHGRRPLSRREAWEWLIEWAAYKPRGHRHYLGVTDLQRGQLCTTIRELAGAWNWESAKGPLVRRVHTFLRRLEREGMIVRECADNLRASGTITGTRFGPWRTVITICKYNEYQPGMRKAQLEAQLSDDDDAPILPGILLEPTSQQEQPTQNNIDSERGGLQGLQAVDFGDKSSTTQWKDKPPHGAKDRKTGKWQWFDHPSSEWTQAARLHTADKGTRIFPKTYKGGRGNWFKVRSDGEIKFLWGKICWQEGIPELGSSQGLPRLPMPNAALLPGQSRKR